MSRLQVVVDPAEILPPPWALRYVFDFRPPRPDAPCPACGEPIDGEDDFRAISFAVSGGQRLCEDCLHDEIPAPLIEATEHLDGVLAAIGSLDEGRLPVVDRAAVRLSTAQILGWVADCVRKVPADRSP